MKRFDQQLMLGNVARSLENARFAAMRNDLVRNFSNYLKCVVLRFQGLKTCHIAVDACWNGVSQLAFKNTSILRIIDTYIQAVQANPRFVSSLQSVVFSIEIFLVKIEIACCKKLKWGVTRSLYWLFLGKYWMPLTPFYNTAAYSLY